MKYFKLIVAYEGTKYFGWQIQNNGPSIQGEMMKAGNQIFREPFTISGASRTDSGVHALGQVVLLTTSGDFPLRKVTNSFNNFLPEDIVVQSAEEVDENFHHRYHAKKKTYRYQIYNHGVALPQNRNFMHFYRKTLNVEEMNKAAQYLVGVHDFKAFCSDKTSVKDTVREIYRASVTKEGHIITFWVEGNGFLYNMVRIIMGTLIAIGVGRINAEDMQRIMASCNRQIAKETAPAKGLTLIRIDYE